MKVTEDLLSELGCGDTPVITVFNKCDRLSALDIAPDSERVVHISAKNGQGIDRLLERIEANLPVSLRRVSLLLPFTAAGLQNEIRQKGTLLSEEYTAEGIRTEAVVDEALYRKVAEYTTE